MISRFFIDRPIFAWVIAIVVMIAGALSILNLPVAQYPNIALPQVAIHATYPGASAKTVEDSVTQVIEQQMKGLDHLLYISSSSESSGQAQITLTFAGGTDPDIAQVQVQNKLQGAVALLPQEVQQQGLSVVKAQRNFLMVVGVYSQNRATGQEDLGDYVASHILDPVSRVNGVGQAQMFGSQYAMRIWLDPSKLAAYSLAPADIVSAIRAQNAQVSAGQLGGQPALPGTALNATITAQSRLQTVEQFRDIILRNTPGAATVRLKDVARVEIGAESYASIARYNGQPSAALGVSLAPGANALDTAKAVKAQLDELAKNFPAGMSYVVAFETTPFVKRSMEEVVKTLVEAIVLVFLVMFLFLQNWRATIIPTIAVPVVLLGTFGVLAAVGYSINTLTMFGMVLAIGFLVDDAIVVVENVERVMREKGLSPREATRESMNEITGALIAIALVLAAVFVPMAFFGGSVGVIYRQFSVTLVSAMILSVLVALILTPALCATLLKPVDADHQVARGPFGWFNRNFDRASLRYQGQVRRLLDRGPRVMIAYGAIVVVLGLMFVRLPSSFLPDEDQGIIMSIVQLPRNATTERTQQVLDKVSDHFLKNEEKVVSSVFTINGFNFGSTGQNVGVMFVRLKPFDERHGKQESAQALVDRARPALMGIREAMVFPILPPSVPELGLASGFDVQLKDIGGVGHDVLMAARDQLLGQASQQKQLVGARPTGQDDMPQLQIKVDLARAGAQGVTSADINSTLSVALGGLYVNDFIDRGRVKKVMVQADAPFRMRPEDLERWFVRNSQGEMAPFSSFASTSWIMGSPKLERYNGVSSVQVQGSSGPGVSTGEAMRTVEKLIEKLPPGIGYEWTGISLQERESGAQAPLLYALSILVVYLLLAALYESWTIPLSVMLIIPLGVVGAVLATQLRGLSNDIYFQVGLLTTMGLAAKNAILIVEFANDRLKHGMTLLAATVDAVRIRLRPIIMTSLAFVFGVMPLAISSGAGSGAQHSIGTGVVGGMITATILGIFFVPVFFVLVQQIFNKRRLDETEPPAAAAEGR